MKSLILILLASGGIHAVGATSSAKVIFKGNCLVYTEPTSATSGPTVLAQTAVALQADVDQVLYVDQDGRSYHVMAYYLGGDHHNPVLSLSIQVDQPRPLNVVTQTVGPLPGPTPGKGVSLISPAINNMSCSGK